MAARKKADVTDEEREVPAPPASMGGGLVRVVITKFGDGKVSTGASVMGEGDIMAKRGDVLETSAECARALEETGLAEKSIAEQRYQLFTTPHSAAVTEIAQFARRKILIVVHGGGDLDELLNVLEPRMCDFALSQGCDAIMGTGRRGWDRVTQKRGYRFAWVNMIKDLA